MTITELHIQLDLQPKNRIDILKDTILKDTTIKCSKGYLFVDSSDGNCYLFDRNGNEDDVKKLTKIDGEMFLYSSIESIIIPGSIESIGRFAFSCCKSLKSIEIPDSVKSIGYDIFYSCESLKSIAFKGKTMKQVKKKNDLLSLLESKINQSSNAFDLTKS